MANKGKKNPSFVRPDKPVRPGPRREDNHVLSRAAGSYCYGGGLTAHTPVAEPRALTAISGTNPNLNNAQKMRSSRDIFMKDISYGGLKNSDGVYSEDFAVQWNEPSNLEYTIASVPVKKVDSRGIWMRDMETHFKFTNMCARTIFLQLHVPLAMVSAPKNAVWKIQNMVKTLKPGKSFMFTRRVTPASRVSPKKSQEFDDKNKCLAADLLEFRVNIEDLSAANEVALRESDAVLRIESGSISDRGHTHGGICYETLDFVPKAVSVQEYPDNQLVWLDKLADGCFDALSPVKLDTMAAFDVPKGTGYSTVAVHPDDEYHNLRGLQIVPISGPSGGSGIMAVTLTNSTSQARPLRISRESDPTAVFTDPALVASVIQHVEDATWTSLYMNYNTFKYLHNAGGWLLWDEENNTFFDANRVGAAKIMLPRYVSIETPIMVTTFDTARVSDYMEHRGVKRDFARLVKQLESTGLSPPEAEKKAEETFVNLCKENFPNDQDIRTEAIDWGQIFCTVLLGAVKMLLA